MFKLRPYQELGLTQITNELKKCSSVLYQLPTGGGKSVIVSKFIENNKGKRIIIFAHKKRILNQLESYMKEIKVTYGFLGNLREERMDSTIVIVSIRTAAKDTRLETLLEKDWEYAIIDEARHSRTASYDKVLNALKAHNVGLKLLGVDATPYRKDKKRLDEHFECLIQSDLDTAGLIKEGYLCSYKTYQAPIGDIDSIVQQVANDYQMQALSNYMRDPKLIEYGLNLYEDYAKGRQTIVFAVDIEHSKMLEEIFKEKKYTVCRIDSTMSSQQIEKAFEDYENGKIQFLINVEMATEGVDLPETACILAFRPTKSLTLFLQMAGRGLRLKENNQNLVVIDIAGWTQEFGSISTHREWSLNPEIDPNSGAKKNRIVGVRENGSLTENLEGHIGEVIELTPEEYVQKMNGGIEYAKDFNANIDLQVTNSLTNFLDVLIDTLNNPKLQKGNFNLVGSKYRDDSFNIVLKDIQRSPNIELDFRAMFSDSVRNHILKVEDTYYATNEIAEGISNLVLLAAEISYHLLNKSKKIEKICQEHFGKVKELTKQKINIAKLEDKLRGHNEEVRKTKILNVIEKEGEVMFINKSVFENDNDFEDTFKEVRAQCPVFDNFFTDKTYERKFIVGIEFPNKKVNEHHNTLHIKYLTSYTKDGPKVLEKKYVKGEKVWQLLGEYKIEQK